MGALCCLGIDMKAFESIGSGLLGLDMHSGAPGWPQLLSQPGALLQDVLTTTSLPPCCVMLLAAHAATHAASTKPHYMPAVLRPACCTDGNGMRHLNCAYSGTGMKPLSNGHASDEVRLCTACLAGLCPV